MLQGLENQQTQCKVQELTARLQASQQETELIQTLMSPHVISTSQSLPTMESSTSLNNTSKIAFQKTTKVSVVCLYIYIYILVNMSINS